MRRLASKTCPLMPPSTALTARLTYALGRDPVEVEQPWVDALIEPFAASNGDEHALLVELMTARTMLEFPP
jgi:hypothetical protein